MMGIEWLPLDTWIVAIAAVAAVACALPGCFLVLRRASMMGDAISHAVLPGLALAFLITGSRDPLPMLIGAAAVGLLTAVLTQWIQSAGRVDPGASMGVVFTVLFALGLILVRQAADRVDLDPDCVLYGTIETAAANTAGYLGVQLPPALVTVGVVLLANVLFVSLLFKELRISSFDPALASALGFRSGLMNYALMTVVAITCVAAFESIGSILVIAMLVTPAATAHLLTDRLSVMLVLAAVLAAAAAVLGHVAALLVGPLVGLPHVSLNTAGAMTVVSGILLVVALVAAPRHGLAVRVVRRFLLAQRITQEDILGALYRAHERGTALGVYDLSRGELMRSSAFQRRWALWRLRQRGLIREDGTALTLTATGLTAAGELIRSHRLWESYLDRAGAASDEELHSAAERLEHVTGAELRRRLYDSVDQPDTDPHGRRIPD